MPYNLPTPIEWPWNEHFRVLDGDVIVFKPREWRGTNKDDAPIFGKLQSQFAHVYSFLYVNFCFDGILQKKKKHEE